MAYTTLQLINNAYYESGIVSRGFETVSGQQANDGLQFLNDLIADKTVENGLIPYYQEYNFTAVTGQERYFIEVDVPGAKTSLSLVPVGVNTQ